MIVIIIVLVMLLIYRFRDRVEKYMPWVWKNIGNPLFNYFFVISIRKVTMMYFATMAGLCVAFPAIQFAIDKEFILFIFPKEKSESFSKKIFLFRIYRWLRK